MPKLPRRLWYAERIHIANLCVFHTSVLAASEVCTLVARRDKRWVHFAGYVTLKGERIYWCRLGLDSDRSIYTSKNERPPKSQKPAHTRTRRPQRRVFVKPANKNS